MMIAAKEGTFAYHTIKHMQSFSEKYICRRIKIPIGRVYEEGGFY